MEVRDLREKKSNATMTISPIAPGMLLDATTSKTVHHKSLLPSRAFAIHSLWQGGQHDSVIGFLLEVCMVEKTKQEKLAGICWNRKRGS